MSARKKASVQFGKSRKQAKRTQEQPVDQAEIRRAAERAGILEIEREAERIGIPPEEVVRQRIAEAERVGLVKAIVPDLLLASDYLAEEIASYEREDESGDSSLVRSALRRIFQIRWSLGLYAGSTETVVGGAS